MVTGIILHVKFYELGGFLMQFSGDPKISRKVALSISGKPPDFLEFRERKKLPSSVSF